MSSGKSGVPAAKQEGVSGRALLLDANILIRAVLGRRVRNIIEAKASEFTFLIPNVALTEAEEHLSTLVAKHGGDPVLAFELLSELAALTTLVDSDVYEEFEVEARMRLAARDQDDWPILAAALALGCPIWTEDTDFFGCGIATWTSANVERFFD
jgi:predicted nucleic acid-binding protein